MATPDNNTIFDLLVLGAGPGGLDAAVEAVALGLRTVVIAEGPVGGTCLHVGCIPTKGLLREPHPDGIAARAADNRAAIATLQAGAERSLRGATVIRGRGRLAGPGPVTADGCPTTNVEVTGHGRVTAKHIVIATGSRPMALPGLPFDGDRVVSSTDLLDPATRPERLVVIGAGAVGVELADVYAAYGTRVTVLERDARLVPAEDAWLGSRLARAFKAKGIVAITGATVNAIERDGDGVRVHGDGFEPLQADRVLVAVGRQSRVDDIGLETVEIDAAQGWIPVDGWGATGIPGIWAIGDVTGAPQLAHRASVQGRIVAEKIAGREPAPLTVDTIPSCVYTRPQLASVGQRLAEGRVAGQALFAANGMAVVSGATEGGVRLIAEARGGRLVGAQLVGGAVTEMIGLLGLAITGGVTVRALAETIFPHPTRSETIAAAARDALRKCDG